MDFQRHWTYEMEEMGVAHLEDNAVKKFNFKMGDY